MSGIGGGKCDCGVSGDHGDLRDSLSRACKNGALDGRGGDVGQVGNARRGLVECTLRIGKVAELGVALMRRVVWGDDDFRRE